MRPSGVRDVYVTRLYDVYYDSLLCALHFLPSTKSWVVIFFLVTISSSCSSLAVSVLLLIAKFSKNHCFSLIHFFIAFFRFHASQSC